MASTLQIAASDAVQRIRRVQAVTIAWMSVEAAVSLFSAWRARSPALLAFGGDSAVELLSAVVVLRRFRTNAAHEHTERRAARVAGLLLFALAAYVALASSMSLLGYSEPKPSALGDRRLGRGSCWDALAREGEAQIVRSHRKCRAASRCRGVSVVCLPFGDCVGRAGDERHLAHEMGRSSCGARHSAAHTLGRSGSYTRQAVRRLLIWALIAWPAGSEFRLPLGWLAKVSSPGIDLARWPYS